MSDISHVKNAINSSDTVVDIYMNMDFDKLFWLVHDGLRVLKREHVKTNEPHLLPKSKAEFNNLIAMLYQRIRSTKLPTIPPIPEKPEVPTFRESDELVKLQQQIGSLQAQVDHIQVNHIQGHGRHYQRGKKNIEKLETRSRDIQEQIKRQKHQEESSYRNRTSLLLEPYRRAVVARKRAIAKLSDGQVKALDLVVLRLKRVERIEQRISEYFKGINRVQRSSKKQKRNILKVKRIPLPKAKRLPWQVLPSGTLSSHKIVGHYQQLSEAYPDISFDMKRLDKVLTLKSKEIYVGTGEMEKYFVMTFSHTDKVLFECPIYGNAIYILSRDWRRLSQLSKRNLREEYGHLATRIIHRDGWFYRLEEELDI